jgi:hypothetical protein
MGWLYQNDPVENPIAYLTGKYNYDGERHTLQVLAAARVANTVYMAIRFTDKASAASYVFAAVILISNTKRHGFGYKDMDEGMGPCECDCPDRIMRLLTPITDLPNPRYAADWRARVAARETEKRRRHARRQSLRIGSIVTLPSPATFPGGFTASTFRVVDFWCRTPVFLALDELLPGFRCRLTAAALAAATITDAQPSDLNKEGV